MNTQLARKRFLVIGSFIFYIIMTFFFYNRKEIMFGMRLWLDFILTVSLILISLVIGILLSLVVGGRKEFGVWKTMLFSWFNGFFSSGCIYGCIIVWAGLLDLTVWPPMLLTAFLILISLVIGILLSLVVGGGKEFSVRKTMLLGWHNGFFGSGCILGCMIALLAFSDLKPWSPLIPSSLLLILPFPLFPYFFIFQYAALVIFQKSFSEFSAKALTMLIILYIGSFVCVIFKLLYLSIPI